MVNDLNTLSGALVECKDQLITELANQGVTATYDPTTGLLGLIHKISEITPTTPSLTLTTNKNILSYYDSETATLTATHSQGAGKTVEIYNAVTGVKIGDMTDNNDGTYTYTYNSAGIGDISMTATAGTTESNSITIEDCYYFNDGSTTNGLEIGSNVSCTSNGEYITITTSTSGEKDVKIPTTLNGDWEYRVTLAETLILGTGQLTFKVGTGQQWGAFNSDGSINIQLGNYQSFNRTISKDMVLKITYINGTMIVYWNDEPLKLSQVTVSGKMGYYTNQSRYQYVKDIVLKAL